MSTKYNVSNSERWWLSNDDHPRFTDHALARWDERTPPWSMSPEQAWSRGIEPEYLADVAFEGDGKTPDEARYVAETSPSESETYGAVLMRLGDAVTTVYVERKFPPVVRAYLNQLAQQRDWRN